MPKKAKQKDKKKSKVKKIPAKAGAKARVSKDGKVEVILPVDRSRGPYKKRKTEEQKIQERLEQLRAQERRQFSRDVLAPERLSSGYRSGGSIYRSDVRAPEGGFTGIVSSKEQKENERLKNVEKKLDKLLDKKPESEPAREPEPAPEPKKEPSELETVQSEIVRANIRRGMERRDREQRQKLAEERARREEEKARREQSRLRVATRRLREEKTAQEQSRRAEEERQKRIEAQQRERRQEDISRQISTRERRLDERERDQRLRESQRELELISQREKAEAHKRREKEDSERTFSGAKRLYKSKITERKQLVDDIMGGEREKLVTLRAEPNPERERRALEQRKKALQDEKAKKDREEAFKEREKIKREEKQLREQEKEKARKDAEDIFSEIERAPKSDVELVVEEIDTDPDDLEEPEDLPPTPPARQPEVEDDDEFKDVQESEPDQDIARELLRDEVNNRERRLKQEQQRANELDKLNREFIAHKNREDRNRRRREERRKRQELAKDVVGKAIQKAETQEQARELLDETIQKAVEKKEARDISKSILSDVIDESVTKSNLENPPVSVGRGRRVDIDKLLQTGATREQIGDYEQDLQRTKRLVDGVYSAFGINLTGTGDGLDYVKSSTSKAKRQQIRIDSIRKLRERGLSVNEIQQFTRTLDEINDLIARRDKFGRDFQRRGGAVQLRPAGGTGRAGRPRGGGQRVPQQVADIEERQDPQPRD